ncbi:YqhV family protein [Anoxybacteroides tepidamans]|uniref:YqhV family protein n=1 Tax=Anoxybacteroides tepidamans TaxID=265948 RepID=UPI000483CF51|nr:YqhV family protein [Anoxybacillus tepidamans]
MKRWLSMIDSAVLSMAGMRLLSATIELTAALVMLFLNDVKKAVAVNAMLAVVGPIIFVVTMTIGLLSVADELSFSKLLWIAFGVGCILFGIYK